MGSAAGDRASRLSPNGRISPLDRGSANKLAWLARAQSGPAAGGGEAFMCPRPAPGEPTCRRVDQETHGGLPAILRAVRQWTGIEHPVLRQLRPRRRRHGGGRIGPARRGGPRARLARTGGRDASRWLAPDAAAAAGAPHLYRASRVRGAPGAALPGRLGGTGLPVARVARVAGLRRPAQVRHPAQFCHPASVLRRPLVLRRRPPRRPRWRPPPSRPGRPAADGVRPAAAARVPIGRPGLLPGGPPRAASGRPLGTTTS